MTQKRFRKLLMSNGVSRNGANRIIEENKKNKVPYEKIYKAYRTIEGLPFKDLSETIEKLTQAVAKVASALCKAFEAFTKELTGGLENGN